MAAFRLGRDMLEFLARNPHHRQRMIDDPDIRASAIEELLRFITPLPALSRTTTTDVVIGDRSIPSGERVQLHWMAANHPGRVPRP